MLSCNLSRTLLIYREYDHCFWIAYIVMVSWYFFPFCCHSHSQMDLWDTAVTMFTFLTMYVIFSTFVLAFRRRDRMPVKQFDSSGCLDRAKPAFIFMFLTGLTPPQGLWVNGLFPVDKYSVCRARPLAGGQGSRGVMAIKQTQDNPVSYKIIFVCS